MGGFQPLDPAIGDSCTLVGEYIPTRIPELILSGMGLNGTLGVDVLASSAAIGDVPVGNLVVLDLSNNNIRGGFGFK